METHCATSGQDSCGLDTSQSGARYEPLPHKSGDRPFSRVQGLRSKARPPTRWGDSPAGQIDGLCQGQVDL